jgi:hypothetical protein
MLFIFFAFFWGGEQTLIVQSFVAEHPFNLIQPLLLRSLTFTPRDNATVFETAPGTCTSGEERLNQVSMRRMGETLGEKYGTFAFFFFPRIFGGVFFFLIFDF